MQNDKSAKDKNIATTDMTEEISKHLYKVTNQNLPYLCKQFSGQVYMF